MIGTILGLLLAVAATRWMQSLLFGVDALNPAIFAGVTTLLLVTAILAACLPAFRAARVDPMVALRHE
jgi:putative ABC transport system permease protein